VRIALFTHSLLSDWNHGNAHFLRGIVTDLVSRGHSVRAYEARDAWSVVNLVRDHGDGPLADVRRVYPALDVVRYGDGPIESWLDEALADADLVLVHEWNEPALVAAIGARRARGGTFRVLFHDTHHRSVSAPDELERYDLSGFDGVLVFGQAIARVYEARGWGRRVWTWHEAADPRVFRPMPEEQVRGDLVWIGNWGDGERSDELADMLIEPAHRLGLSTRVHGVRYPDDALARLRRAGIEHAGWLPNYEVPRAFAQHRVTVHVPRRFYREHLPGIPTIRPFEAMACGIPLVSAPWADDEGLFRAGRDYLVAHDGLEMERLLRALVLDGAMRDELGRSGRETVLARHTTAHRVDELVRIASAIGVRDEARVTKAVA
jgi:spore maturation protein CgeB